jgi:hypothetical protein
VSYYYSSNFKGADLVIPAFVFDNENNFYKVEIDDFVFAQTRIVGMATISDGVANIGHYAFSDSKYLTSLYLGNGLQNISSNAFNGCSSLTSISIPTSLSTIKEGVFADSIQIANIDLGERNEKLIVENNSFKNLPFNGNISCSGL